MAPSPAPDPLALNAYASINRLLKDAYPESYNSDNRLWDIIMKIADFIGPALGLIPEVGPILSGAVKGAQTIGTAIMDIRDAYQDGKRAGRAEVGSMAKNKELIATATAAATTAARVAGGLINKGKGTFPRK